MKIRVMFSFAQDMRVKTVPCRMMSPIEKEIHQVHKELETAALDRDAVNVIAQASERLIEDLFREAMSCASIRSEALHPRHIKLASRMFGSTNKLVPVAPKLDLKSADTL